MATVQPSSTGTFTLLLFASAQTYTSQSQISLPAPMPLRELFPTLESKFPGIADKVLNSCAVSVNLEYVDMPESGTVGDAEEQVVIQPGDEVGIIPPVSSG